MITREQLLGLLDDAERALKVLRKRLASPACEPPPVVVARAAIMLSTAAARLAKLDDDVRRSVEKPPPRDRTA